METFVTAQPLHGIPTMTTTPLPPAWVSTSKINEGNDKRVTDQEGEGKSKRKRKETRKKKKTKHPQQGTKRYEVCDRSCVLGLSDNVQASMFRMADEFAFPKRITKRRFSLELFKTQSTNPKAWVGPIRDELMDVYKRLNQAIAK